LIIRISMKEYELRLSSLSIPALSTYTVVERLLIC
jgi:hypothetical protein